MESSKDFKKKAESENETEEQKDQSKSPDPFINLREKFHNSPEVQRRMKNKTSNKLTFLAHNEKGIISQEKMSQDQLFSLIELLLSKIRDITLSAYSIAEELGNFDLNYKIAVSSWVHAKDQKLTPLVDVLRNAESIQTLDFQQHLSKKILENIKIDLISLLNETINSIIQLQSNKLDMLTKSMLEVSDKLNELDQLRISLLSSQDVRADIINIKELIKQNKSEPLHMIDALKRMQARLEKIIKIPNIIYNLRPADANALNSELITILTGIDQAITHLKKVDTANATEQEKLLSEINDLIKKYEIVETEFLPFFFEVASNIKDDLRPELTKQEKLIHSSIEKLHKFKEEKINEINVIMSKLETLSMQIAGLPNENSLKAK